MLNRWAAMRVNDDENSSSTDLLYSGDEGADRRGVPARADELVARGPLGSRKRMLRARRVAGWTDLSATVRSLSRRSFAVLLRAQAQRGLGTRRSVRGRVEAPLARRAPRFRHLCTWTRGYYFTEDKDCENLEGTKLPIPYRLRSIPVAQFANERRRGWEEAGDSPEREPRDAWDERRNARMQKRQPRGHRLLCVESLGSAGGEFGVDQAVDGLRVGYWLERDGEIQLLNHLQWADWDPDGHLLVVTRSGKLQILDFNGDRSEVLFEEDLSLFEPNPTPAPAWAGRW